MTASAIKGFVERKASTNRRIVLNVEGLEKKGKSTLGLSAPGPIALYDFDIGLEGVIEPWLEKKKIYVPDESFRYRDATDINEWEQIWEAYKKSFLRAVACAHVRTIMLDTGTEAWELARLARFGKLTQVMPHHYGPVNAEFRDLYRKVYDTDKNLIILHKLKSKYVNDKRTDEFEMSGFGDTPYIAQVNVRVWRKSEDEDRSRPFGLTVLSCRQNAEIDGMELEGPMCNFQFLASMVYPDTDPGDWE